MSPKEILKNKARKFQLNKDYKSDLQEIKEINSEFSSSSSETNVEFDPECLIAAIMNKIGRIVVAEDQLITITVL